MVLQILLLGSEDLRNALLTVSELAEAYQELKIHLIDDNDICTAQNVLLLHIILSDDFDPAIESDLDYLWNVWYSLQWTEETRMSFVKDVGQLLSHQWPENFEVNISDQQTILKKIFHSWRNIAFCEMPAVKMESSLKERFISYILKMHAPKR